MNDRRTLVLPILLIMIGTGWLLSTLGIAPDINWVWTLGLGAAGAWVFALYGFDKVTLVVGGFFVVASLLSVLRQTGRNFDRCGDTDSGDRCRIAADGVPASARAGAGVVEGLIRKVRVT